MSSKVWVFHAENGQLASGVFSSQAKAEEWIGKHSLSGLLTAYALDSGAWEAAIEQGHFTPKKDSQRTAAFIGAFSGGQEHQHYREGKRED